MSGGYFQRLTPSVRCPWRCVGITNSDDERIGISKAFLRRHLVSAPPGPPRPPLAAPWGKVQRRSARSGHAAQDGRGVGPSGVLWGNDLGKGGWERLGNALATAVRLSLSGWR